MTAKPFGMAMLFALLGLPTLPAATAAAQELRDPMQPPPLALRKFREARQAKEPRQAPQPRAAPAKPFRLTSILIGSGRSIAIIDEQMLVIGDSVRGARLVGLTRDSARLVQRGKIINLKLDDGAGVTISKKAVKDKP